MIDAVIGAIVGALVGGVISAFVTFRVTRKGMTWEIVHHASEVQAEILSAFALDKIKSPDEVLELQSQWGKQSRQLHVFVDEEKTGELNNILFPYLDALRDYVQQKMPRSQLEQRRKDAKDAVTKIMRQLR